MLFELHSHTTYSHGAKVYHEGMNTPEEMVKETARLGLDGIAITDHNRIEGALEAMRYAKKYDVMVIPGEEVSSRDGHILGLGIEKHVQPGRSTEKTVEDIHEQGGIAIAPHPFDIRSKGIGKKSVKCDAIEVFNSMNIERSSNRKNIKFVEQVGKPYTVGSDAHDKYMIGSTVNKIKGDTMEDILESIKKGGIEVKMDYIPLATIKKWALNRLQSSYGYTTNYINRNYKGPKKMLSKYLLSKVKKPESHKKFFNFLSYVAIFGTVTYGLLHAAKPL
ncbi:MAG: CehA/McbA family metallohydrolase [Candidatus Aenigmatarchaeota archaeon]